MGVLVFVGILLMFQALRLSNMLIAHGVGIKIVGQILLYLSISFLPIILPMALLFAVLLTYNRLSNDSEIVAFKALGVSMGQLTIPALIISLAATLMSAQTSFYLGPWGNRKFEVLITELGRQEAAATLKEGVFSEGFFDLVVYSNKVDSKAGLLTDVFIYDERDPKSPVTIIAKQGHLIQEQSKEGLRALLRLSNGNIHRTNLNTYTKVDFSSYDITLFNPYDTSEKKKSGPSMTLDDLSAELKRTDLEVKDRRKLEVEYHRRWSLSSACLIFALLGVGLGTVVNRRSSRGGGFVICLGLLISYWICYVSAEAIATRGWTPAAVSLWSVNLIFLLIALKSLKRVWT
jgi:lipopolysaccharide export system permease protein